MTPNIADMIRHHVSLEVRCIDRIYLHVYMPKLQTSGGLCYFFHDYLGHPVPSPALLKPRHDGFLAAVKTFAHDRAIPVVEFERGDIRGGPAGIFSENPVEDHGSRARIR